MKINRKKQYMPILVLILVFIFISNIINAENSFDNLTYIDRVNDKSPFQTNVNIDDRFFTMNLDLINSFKKLSTPQMDYCFDNVQLLISTNFSTSNNYMPINRANQKFRAFQGEESPKRGILLPLDIPTNLTSSIVINNSEFVSVKNIFETAQINKIKQTVEVTNPLQIPQNCHITFKITTSQIIEINPDLNTERYFDNNKVIFIDKDNNKIGSFSWDDIIEMGLKPSLSIYRSEGMNILELSVNLNLTPNETIIIDPTYNLGLDADLTIYGANSYDYSGWAVAAGDINGDGKEDIIIGAEYADPNNRKNAGEIYIIYGDSQTNLGTIKDLGAAPSDADLIIYGAEPWDFAGSMVATGDIDGDGLNDVVIGAEGADGPNNTRTRCGEAYVIFGNTVLPSIIDLNTTNISYQHADLVIYGADSDDNLSLWGSIALGDIDNDGKDDIIIGAPTADGLNNNVDDAGEIYIIYGDNRTNLGTTRDLATSANITIYGINKYDNSGSAVASGDIDGDSMDDIIIGVPYADVPGQNRGKTYVIYGNNNRIVQGATKELETDANLTISGIDNGDLSGCALATGDINKDGKADIIIGARRADGLSNARAEAGETYVVYGDSRVNLGTPMDLDNANLTIYGADPEDYSGISVCSGDIDGDETDDIIISADWADGPDNRHDKMGETYVVYSNGSLGSIIDLNMTTNHTHSNLTFYGAAAGDESSSSIATGDINGDGKDDIIIGAYRAEPNSAIINAGETYLIFGRHRYQLQPKINMLTLVNGGGEGGKVCYAGYYKPYIFRVNITDPMSLGDIDTVGINLDPGGLNLSYTWVEDTDTFLETNDTNNYASIVSNSTHSTNDGSYTWILDFEIIFGWNYPTENLSACQVYAITDEKYFVDAILINNIYRVENDLNFTGKLTAVGEYQGELSYGDWVQVNEAITWGGLTVVYDNTTDIYPSDEFFNVTITDDDDTAWTSTTSSGNPFKLITQVDPIPDDSDIHIINITNIPHYGMDLSDHTFELKVASPNITFINAEPSSSIWHKTRTVTCNITVVDTNGNMVNTSSIEYCISTNGTLDYESWIKAGATENGVSINCSIIAIFNEGANNYIKWRAQDLLGLIYWGSEDYRIKIDTKKVTFLNPSPAPIEWQIATNVTCSITIDDKNGGGINARTIEYCFSTNGISEYCEWINAGRIINSTTIICSVNTTFQYGTNNYIKWRAEDVVGNGYNESEDYQIIIIDIGQELPEVTLSYPLDNSTVQTTAPLLTWTCNLDNDTSEETSSLSFFIYLSTDRNAVFNYNETALISIEHNTTFITPELNDLTIYYWTVIPNNGFIDGRCISGVWSFYVNLSGLNNFPVVVLKNPTNGSTIKSTSVLLSWGGYNPKGDYPIYYDIYLSSNKALISNHNKTTRIATNITTSEFNVSNLADNTIYYWIIIPNDGELQGICISGIWEFAVNIANEKPIVTLQLPRNNSIVDDTPGLSWIINDPDPYDIFTSEVYFSFNETMVIELNNTVKNSSFYRETSYDLFGLANGTVYYWTVIPHDGTEYGKCLSGVWNFLVDVTMQNLPPVAVISYPGNNSTFLPGERIYFDAGNSTDINGEDILSFYWTSDIVGRIGNTSKFWNILPEGLHLITLYVNDGCGHNVSTFVNIIIGELSSEEKDKGVDNLVNIIIALVILVIIIFIIISIKIFYIRKIEKDKEKNDKKELKVIPIKTHKIQKLKKLRKSKFKNVIDKEGKQLKGTIVKERRLKKT